MPEAKFYQLVSKHSGCALGPENNNDAPGARLVTVARNEGDQRQFWFTDALSGTVRNMVSGLCISIAGTCIKSSKVQGFRKVSFGLRTGRIETWQIA